MSGSVRNRPCAVALALVLALGLGLAAEPPAAPAPSPAAPGAPQVPFADLLPADVLASARLGPIPELIRRFRAAALDGLPADRRAECAQALDAACRDAGAEILARLHVDLAPVLAHTLALHVAVVEIWTGIETVRPHLLIGVETDDAALPAAWIDSALAAVESDRMEHGEHLIHELALSSEEGALAAIYAAPAGRFLLAATAADFVGAALDRYDAGCVAAAAASRTPDGPAAAGAGAGGAPSVRSPGTAAPEWARRVAEVPAAAGMPLAAHADTRRIAAALRRALGRAALREIEECEARFGLDALAALDLRCEWVESTVSARLDVALRGENELLAALRSPGGRHEAFRVAVPQDAVFAVSARFPDLAATWTALRRLLERHEETREEEPARREFARALAEFERKGGTPVAELLGESGGETVLWLRPHGMWGEGGLEPDELEWGWAISAAAPERAADRLERALIAGADRAGFLRKEAAGISYRTTPRGPAFAVRPGFLVGAGDEAELYGALSALPAPPRAPEPGGAAAGGPAPEAGSEAPMVGRADLRWPALAWTPPLGRDHAWWGDAGPCPARLHLLEREEGPALAGACDATALARVVAAAIAAGLPVLAAERHRAEAQSCTRHLLELAALIDEFRGRSPNPARYPESLEELEQEFNLDEGQFHCPVNTGGEGEPARGGRYVYVSPLEGEETPGGQILLYEDHAVHSGTHTVVRFERGATSMSQGEFKRTLGVQASELRGRAAERRRSAERRLAELGESPEREEAVEQVSGLERMETDYQAMLASLALIEEREGPAPAPRAQRLAGLRSAAAGLAALRLRTPLADAVIEELATKIEELEGAGAEREAAGAEGGAGAGAGGS